jgi:hypothetical protein
VLAERIRERRDLLGIEQTARLIGIRVHLIDREVDEVCRGERAGLEPPFLASEKGFQAASKSSFIHGR